MAYYNTCPYCGANLDPNEKCECQTEKNKLAKQYQEITSKKPDGQVVLAL